jgi:hypothetical protein
MDASAAAAQWTLPSPSVPSKVPTCLRNVPSTPHRTSSSVYVFVPWLTHPAAAAAAANSTVSLVCCRHNSQLKLLPCNRQCDVSCST